MAKQGQRCMGRGRFSSALSATSYVNEMYRALSNTWEMQSNPIGSKYPNALSQISIFVLLEFLGSANPTIPFYLLTTHWVCDHLASLEKRLRRLDILETRPMSSFFFKTSRPQLEPVDDHVPFMNRGVPFLHILPSQFPQGQQTLEDDGQHLDLPTVRDLATIMAGFALEWLDMMEVWPE